MPTVRTGAGHWQEVPRPGCPVTISRTVACVCVGVCVCVCHKHTEERPRRHFGSAGAAAGPGSGLGGTERAVCLCALPYVVACLTGLEVT